MAQAVEEERGRIARRLHDELGAGLTQISLLSALAGDAAATPEETQTATRRIETLSRDLARSVDAMVWAMRSRNDNLASFIEYLGCAARELCEGAGVRCRFSEPSTAPPWAMAANVRQRLLEASREALTNALQHSGASEVAIRTEVRDGEFSVLIEDDGRGFETGDWNRGQGGLERMRGGLLEIGGGCTWRSVVGQGTVVRLVLPRAALTSPPGKEAAARA